MKKWGINTSRYFGTPHRPLAGYGSFHVGRRGKNGLKGAGRGESRGALPGTSLLRRRGRTDSRAGPVALKAEEANDERQVPLSIRDCAGS